MNEYLFYFTAEVVRQNPPIFLLLIVHVVVDLVVGFRVQVSYALGKTFHDTRPEPWPTSFS